ncbi:flagellar type III secretion system protein FlhB [Rhodobacteraceae bacterium]|nr:flagellar type III secretion system protein FlhB [Paracoccaceae bacterium]
MSQQDDQDKQHDASQKKLDDARKKGDIARSNEANAAAVFLSVVGFWAFAGPWVIDDAGVRLMGFLEPAADYSWDAIGARLRNLLMPIFVGFLVPVVAVLISVSVQKSWTFAPQKIAPKLSNLSIPKNFKQKFGPTGLSEFGKNLIKISVVLTVSVWVAFSFATQVTSTSNVALVLGVVAMISDVMALLWAVAAPLVVFAVVDIIWQRHKFAASMRMSHQELKDEFKESEGDPHLKQARRQKGIDIANQSLLKDVASADVVIVNPTHYAVALAWDRGSTTAPKCVAKGVDHMAKSIRGAAAEYHIAIHSDPPTARAIYATTEIGQQIDPIHYAAVAAAIRFADSLNSKKRSLP